MSDSELGAKGEGDTAAELDKPRFEAGCVGEPATAALPDARITPSLRPLTLFL